MAREWEQYIDDVDEEINTSHLTANQAKKILKKTKKELAGDDDQTLGNNRGPSGDFTQNLEKRDEISLPEMLWRELGMPAQPPQVGHITCLNFSGDTRRYFRWKYSASGKANYLRMHCNKLNVPLLDALPLLRLFAARFGEMQIDLTGNIGRARSFNAAVLTIFAQLLLASSAAEADELYDILHTLISRLTVERMLDTQIFPTFFQILQNVLGYIPQRVAVSHPTEQRKDSKIAVPQKISRSDSLVEKLAEINKRFADGFNCDVTSLISSSLDSVDLRNALISQDDRQLTGNDGSDAVEVVFDEDLTDMTFIRPEAVYYACVIAAGFLENNLDFLTIAPSNSASPSDADWKIVYLSDRASDNAETNVRELLAEYMLQFAVCLCCDDRLKHVTSAYLDAAISMILRQVFEFWNPQPSYTELMHRIARNLLAPMKSTNALFTNTRLFDYFPRHTALLKRISTGVIQMMVYETLYELYNQDSKNNLLANSGLVHVTPADVIALQCAVNPLTKQIANVKSWMKHSLPTKSTQLETQAEEKSVAVVRHLMLAVHVAWQALKYVIERADCCEPNLYAEDSLRTLPPANEMIGSPFPRNPAEAYIVVDFYEFLSEISRQPISPPNSTSVASVAEDLIGFLRNYALTLQSRMRSARHKANTFLKHSSQ